MIDEVLSDTGLHPVKKVMGPNWRVWAWIKEQFSATSLWTIAGVVVSALGYLWFEQLELTKVRERVIVLETQVVPVVQGAQRIDALDHRVSLLEGIVNQATTEARKPIAVQWAPAKTRSKGRP